MGKSIVYSASRLSTGEQYIGCTCGTLLRRKHSHFTEANRGKSGKFLDALRSDGPAGFRWDVEREFDDHAAALAFEAELVRRRNTIEAGLNSQPGGRRNGSRPRTDEERAQLRAMAIERTHRPGYGQEIAGKLKAFFETPEGQRQLRERKRVANRLEVRAAMSVGHGGRPIDALRDGRVVATYVSQGECAQALGTSQGNVWAAVHGRARSVRGLQLRFAAEGTPVPPDSPRADPALLA